MPETEVREAPKRAAMAVCGCCGEPSEMYWIPDDHWTLMPERYRVGMHVCFDCYIQQAIQRNIDPQFDAVCRALEAAADEEAAHEEVA